MRVASIARWLGTVVLIAFPGHMVMFAQLAKAQSSPKSPPAPREINSGPLVWVSSDVNPQTVFWVQGRFVPLDDPKHQGDADVATILCSIRERECLVIDSTITFGYIEQAWIQEFKPVSWNQSGLVAASRSLDGCTDETLRVRFNPLSVLVVNSPVLPMSKACKGWNDASDKLAGKKGETLKDQTEQDVLVPTRSFLPAQDFVPPKPTP